MSAGPLILYESIIVAPVRFDLGTNWAAADKRFDNGLHILALPECALTLGMLPLVTPIMPATKRHGTKVIRLEAHSRIAA
jgi:hypothetical protein